MELVKKYFPNYSMHVLPKEILVICFEYLVEERLTYFIWKVVKYNAFNDVRIGKYEIININGSVEYSETGYEQ